MTAPPRRPSAHPSLRQAQIVLLAMALGIVAMTTVALLLRPSLRSSGAAARLLPLVLVGLAASEVGIYVLLRRRTAASLAGMKDQALQLLREGRLPQPLWVLTIVGGALAEGPGLLGCVAFVIGGPWYLLAAPALSVALIVLLAPTRGRAEALVRGGS